MTALAAGDGMESVLAHRVVLEVDSVHESGDVVKGKAKGKNKDKGKKKNKGKGKDTAKLAEECADLLILVIGTAIAADFDLRKAFWDKMETIMQRDSRMINGRIRVSEFRDA